MARGKAQKPTDQRRVVVPARVQSNEPLIRTLPGAPGAPGGPPTAIGLILEGEPGEEGAAGVPGPPGAPGRDGTIGRDGVPGLDGEEGADGPPGPPGPPGTAGTTGAAGPTGPPGTSGEDGEDGPFGPPGPVGPIGPTGGTGSVGPVGAPGADGDEGEMGWPGPPGAAAPQGVYAQITPSDPASTTSTTYVMAGVQSGVSTLTPVATGIVIVSAQVSRETAAILGTTRIALRYGTGTGPANGAADTGTLIGAPFVSSAAQVTVDEALALVGVISGLAVGVPIWIDLAFIAPNLTALQLSDIVIVAHEYMGAALVTPSFVGPAGPTGPPMFGLDGEDGVDGAPGPPGPQGPAGGGGGGSSFTALVQDLGAARRSGTFDITGLAGLTVDKLVLVVQTAAPVASKGNARDEFEMDNVQATGYVVDAATIRVYWQAPSVVVGDVAFGYAVTS